MQAQVGIPINVSSAKYRVLFFLLLIASAVWIVGLIGAVGNLQSQTERARHPLYFGYRMQEVSGYTLEAKEAGAGMRDILLAVDGRPFSGYSVLFEELDKRRAGDLLPITIRHPDGAIAQVSIKLRATTEHPATVGEWFAQLSLAAFFPLFCLCLGFWVAAQRPSDPIAWLLLGMMLSFEGLVTNSAWPGIWRAFPNGWEALTASTLPIWMMLFGLYFSGTLDIDRRAPWLKWTIILPLMASAILMVVFQVGRVISFDAVAWMRPLLLRIDMGQRILGMVAISLFFTFLGTKSGSPATPPDARRRLRILWLGTAVAFTPSFILAVSSLIRGSDFGWNTPDWILLLTLSVLMIAPVTLAYVIVVQRAMDLRMVLRQSAKYALARGGLRVLRVVLITLASILISNVFVNRSFRRVDQAAAMGVALLLLVLRGRFIDRLSGWMDRKFFREAYSSEQILSDLSVEARKFVQVKPLLETVTRRISETLHVPKISVLLRGEDGYRVEPLDGQASSGVLQLPPEAASIQLLRASDRPAMVYFDDDNSWVHGAPPEEQRTLRDLDAQLLLPLPGREQLVGVLALSAKRSEEPYSPSDLQLLQSVAIQTGLALENSQLFATLAAEAVHRERLNREMEIAREVQERLFPQKSPLIAGAALAGRCLPAQDVGGDYYDFVELPDGKLGIAIGDVAGKGISAALLMAGLRASLRGQTIGGASDLAGLMRNMNQLIYESSSKNRFATFFYGQYDPQTRRFDYVNAGHNAPMILRGGEEMRLGPGGPALGLIPRANYRQDGCELHPGDVFLGFTDGFSEAMSATNEEWGDERFVEAARGSQQRDPRGMIDSLIAAVQAFATGAEQHDDMTLIVMKLIPMG